MKKILPLLAAISLTACAANVTPEPEVVYDFEENGTLERNEEGMTPGTWYLRHGSGEGMFIRLSFDEDTVCVLDGEDSACPRSMFIDELPVTIRGMKAEDGHIAVDEMEVLEELNDEA